MRNARDHQQLVQSSNFSLGHLIVSISPTFRTSRWDAIHRTETRGSATAYLVAQAQLAEILSSLRDLLVHIVLEEAAELL